MHRHRVGVRVAAAAGVAVALSAAPVGSLVAGAASAATARSAIAVDVSAGGPYRSSPGGRVTLLGRYAVAGQTKTLADLKAIGQALVRYRAANGTFPPASLLTSTGQPGLSWRVLLLPYLGQQALYDRFDLTKAWDDPANKALLSAMPAVYRSAGAKATATTTGYAGVGGKKSVFRLPGATVSSGVRLADVIDFDNMTLAAGPVGSAVKIPWTSPGDLTISDTTVLGTTGGFAGPGTVATPLLFLDGSVHTLANTTPGGILQEWSTMASAVGCAPPDGYELDLQPSWDLDGNGSFESTGLSASFITAAKGTKTVRFRVTDPSGASHVTSARIVIA